jgi:4-hydroxybenzoate polyprenyltransferase
MKNTLKACLDLTRLHFFFVWPTLFCAGLFLAFQNYGGFSWMLVVQTVLIGLLGFEAGLVLNDIVDSDIDKKETQTDKLTKYWRVFGKRPISEGLISRKNAISLFIALLAATAIITFTLPYPNALYVVGIMAVCYCLEVFYQIKKRNQTHPIAQVIGRIDFTLFPVAGYLCIGSPDINVLLFALFFYPLAQAHLGVNDLIDVTNDEAKQMKTIPILYGLKKTSYWILAFSVTHFVTALIFLTTLRTVAIAGFAVGFALLTIGNYIIQKGKTADAGMKALPLFHVTMLIYALSIILQYFT